jgi:putative ATPase
MPTIKRVLGDGISVIDPAPAVARQTLRLLGDEEITGVTTFLTTGQPAAFAEQIKALLRIDARPQRVVVAAPGAIVAGARITAITGDLTAQTVDAIVNAANDNLQHGGGVAAAIVRAGGPVIQQESDEWIRRNGRVPVGGAAITSAGVMPAEYVIHVAGPIYQSGQDNEGLLRAAVAGALDAAAGVGARSIAFPAISAGIYGYPLGEAAAVLADEVAQWLARNPGTLEEVRLVGFNEAAAEHLRTGIAQAVAAG